MRFLFWNFNTRGRIENPEAILAQTALAHNVDLVMLAECEVDPRTILEGLNREESSYCFRESPNRRFRVFGRFPGEALEQFAETSRMCVWRLRLPAMQEILLAVIHFQDKRNYTSSQHSLTFPLAGFLRKAELRAEHRRTVLVGDFNMNPFDNGMVDINGFGAMMTKGLARKHESADPELGQRFYNPMWGRFGDQSVGPPGTYYHHQIDNMNTYWHTLDQLLIRPDLIHAFREDSLQVLTKVPSGDGEIDLIQEKRKHWKLVVSDHLPLLFEMNLLKDLPHE